MQSIRNDAAQFMRRSGDDTARASALLSAQLLCGEDLATALNGAAQERLRLTRKLAIRLERERQKGLRGHWNYNLDRHIGLRQALDLLKAATPART